MMQLYFRYLGKMLIEGEDMEVVFNGDGSDKDI